MFFENGQRKKKVNRFYGARKDPGPPYFVQYIMATCNILNIQDVSINELKIRLSMIVERLNQLIKRVTEKTELGVFLIDICQDFELDMKENWEKVTVITLDDKLDALR